MKTTLLFFLCLIGQSLSAKTITVTNGNDAGLGSLRNALEQTRDGDVIEFSGVEEVTLISSILNINENVTIKGNGTTLRANFSPLMKVATNATVRWERFNFEVPSNSFSQLVSPKKARVIFEVCRGQWENPNPSMTNTSKNSTEIVMEELRKGGGINYFVTPCPDPDNCGGGGGGGGGDNPSCSISVITRNITVQLSSGGNVTITPDQINNGSTGTCGPISFSLSRTFFTCDEIGPNIVTLSVIDANGSISNASATVTVVDNTAPSIASPQPVVVNTSNCTANVSLTTPPVLDACGISSITRNPSTNTFPVGVTSVVWTVTDVNGNTATTTQTVTVRDATPPAFTTTPQNITVNGAPNCATVSLTPPSASDNCGNTSITRSPEGNNFCIGTTSVVWTATDASGNTATITQNVTVRDVTPPTFTTTPQNLTVNGAPNCTAVTLSTPAATDNWSNVTITSNVASGSSFCIGTTAVVWTATDASGNTATFTQTITVRDVTPPMVTTPQPVNVNGAPCTAVVNLTLPAATDNTGIASITRIPAGDTFTVGTTDVLWTIADNSGNTTLVTQQVVVADVTPPTVVTRNITVQLDANGSLSITDDSVDNGSTDACGPVTLSVSKKTFDCGNIGTNTVTLTVTDNSGNSAQSTAIVTVQGASITYYLDNDGDGFGNPQNSTTLCSNTPPIGYVTNNTDCNDNNAAISPNTVWYKDADNDGYSDGTTQIQCAQPTNFRLASALTATNGDCDENNSNINPGASEACDGIDNNCNGQIDEGSTSTFYLDSDGDGFGNPSVSLQACLAPENYVTNNTDCDDSRADINPNTVWYEDRDGDGFPSNRTLTGCSRPQFFYGGVFSTTFTLGKLASELTGLTVDCDDTEASVSPGTLWYKDADNDGFSDGTSQQSCFQPSGYKSAGNVVPGGDCNDADAAINPNTRWYPDLDNDNYSNGNFIVQCARPENYKLLRELTSTVGDCNDNDESINPNTLWFKDQDGDGYTNGQTLRQCSRPENYKLQSELTNFATDCNDLDNEINPVTKWYKDADNDGYSEGTTVTQCLQPLGYRLESDLIGTSGDCNDSDATIMPGATEVCGNGKDDDCNLATSDVCALPDTDEDGVADEDDCAPNDATKYRNGTFFIDTDNDGYDNGQAVICYGEEIPNGYKATTLGTDCDDTNAAITVSRTWYQDADNDGYSEGTTVTQCLQPLGYRLESDLIATNGDCNDSDATINPGATEVCGNGKDDDCNLATSDVCALPDTDEDGVADEDDCAPNDATKYRNGTFFIDTDNDGYDNGQAVICYGEEIPNGYKATTLGTDCDDTNAAITVSRTWYQDADNDGYSEGTTVTQCLQPLGYRLESDLIATNGDCNDSDATINPGATEVCGNGKDDDCNLATSDVCALPDTDEDGVADEDDCAPNDATKYRNGTFFIDTDNDGYDNGQAVICYGEEIPNGYKATTLGTDCDDTNAAITVSRTWYQDTDNDGYSNGNTLTQCTRPQGYKLSSELTATTGDCNDDNSAINPGASEACDGIDNNCNLQTDEGFPDANNNGVADCVDPDNDMISFTLINAGTNTDILTLTDGLQVSQNQVQGLSLNIRANTNPSVVGSVFITLSGPVNRTITENVAPYALFGDKNGDYNGRSLPAGNYTLTATPYTQTNRRGTVGATTTIQFSIVPETVSVTGITTTPSTASIAVGSTLQVTATVLPSNAINKTVVWSTSDQEVATVSTSGLVSAISPGEAIITATTQDGNFFDITEVTVTNASPLSIGSFTLINAGTDTDILTLTDGLQISQSQIQGLSLNIRANTNPSVVGSVFLRISGPINRTITENVAPYALFGDKNGNYNGRNLPVGNYTLEATPYSQSNRRGTMGSTRTIKFSITSDAFRMDGTNAESDESDNPEENADVMEKEVQARDIPRITRMYPNPVAEIINLELSGQVEEHLEVSIYDLKGVRLFNQELKSEDGTLMLDISDLRLKPGMFVLMVNTNGYLQTFKFLKK
ncbi:MopE-related protein [Aquiflexum gelatinilyticum]|uniref:MopE-related protein n=1 Tax=Aquiflexum gelatinilyticum TaxID=2961943 RepID=A0A9X2PC02_9BACT|nr:MopE-related protein [Aquiflexum gelatinilyticum]MCR9015940.1 MopE-related protein [Aquiflexum gelatinilyticum]